jgi:hypothetical protein
MVLYGANTCTGGVKSTNCVKIARYPRLVSYNSEANLRIVKKKLNHDDSYVKIANFSCSREHQRRRRGETSNRFGQPVRKEGRVGLFRLGAYLSIKTEYNRSHSVQDQITKQF